MIKNTSISRCLKSDFVALEKKEENSFILRWGKKDEFVQFFVLNESTGKPEFTGEFIETGWCTFESGEYEGVLTPFLLDKNGLDKAVRNASISEYKFMYDKMGVDEVEQVDLLKDKLKLEIERYDSSLDVNSFFISGVQTWIDKATRVGLKLRFEAEKRLGKTETVLWQNGVQFPLSLEGDLTAFDMLDGIELYASSCYDTTQKHLANIVTLTSVREVENYDYTAGYPQKLIF